MEGKQDDILLDWIDSEILQIFRNFLQSINPDNGESKCVIVYNIDYPCIGIQNNHKKNPRIDFVIHILVSKTWQKV